MKNIRNLYNEEQLSLLESINIYLDNEKDYSIDELADLYDEITDYYQVACFDKRGEPLPSAYKWETIFDILYDNTGIWSVRNFKYRPYKINKYKSLSE